MCGLFTDDKFKLDEFNSKNICIYINQMFVNITFHAHYILSFLECQIGKALLHVET